jgi:hypothetical protein
MSFERVEPIRSWVSNDYDPMMWTTKEGKRLRITEMTDSHLVNTVKYLDKRFGNKRLVNCEVYNNMLKLLKEKNIDTRSEWDA